MKVTRSVALAAAVALMAVACTPPGPGPEGTSGASPSAASASPTSAWSAADGLPTTSLAAFSGFAGVPLHDPDTPAYPGAATPTSLDGVQVEASLQQTIDLPGVEEALTGQGFVVVPGDYRMLSFAYDDNTYSGTPSYVTTDAAYHVWHLAFDKVLRDLEQTTLLPALEQLVTGLLGAAETQTAELEGTPAADSASRVEQLYQVTAAELGLDVTLGPLAVQEKALIDEHAQTIESPLLGCTIPYSLFTPRGHYTRNADLTRYFLGMSVLGQLGFCLPGTLGAPEGDAGLEPTRMAVLASRPLVADPDLVALWRQVYEPTGFLVGFADDYTPLELADAADSVSPTWLADPTAFDDDAAVTALVENLTAARPVLINADRASIRLMGTRFVLDSFVLDQLLPPYVQYNSATPPELRSLPSALDVAATLGSSLARDVQQESGQGDYANYDAQLAALTGAVASRPVADWGKTVYDAWLYAIQPTFAAHGTAFPDYQRTPAWAAKGLQSGLGSYAELKHDTILYAKQAFAEMGGDFPQAIPRHAVEPDPVAFERLAAVADLMRRGMAERSLLPADQADLLADVTELFDFLGGVARTELAGDAITAVDNERLNGIGSALEGFAMRTSDVAADGSLEGDQDAAVIADIATGLDGEVLEIGTGRFDRILVLVPDSAGGFQVAAGAVYSFYEFTSETGERLTDEAWRAKLDAGDVPERPAWQGVLFAE